MFNRDINFIHDETINNTFAICKHYVCLNNACQPVNFLFMIKTTEIERIEAAIKHKGMTLPDFQRALKIQSQHWNNWKNRGIPKSSLIPISELLDVSIDWITKGAYPPVWLGATNNNAVAEQHPALTSVQIIEWENPEDLPPDRYALIPRFTPKLSAGNGSLIWQAADL